ncbi:hypothetical protein C0989_006581 [Termitomyces sp. Mn162]|nr:hypothetical protein C0989_006581 [Termitomyces sp. Mn162]
MPQAEVIVEEFARALAWARSPPMLEWCQNKAPCVLCMQRGKACVFDAPSMGSQHDTSVCLPCCVSHKKCSILLEWQAACVAAEQEWDKDWVWSQLGKAQKTQISGEVSVGQSAGQVGPPQGGQREGASSAADHGKQRASPPLGVGPSKRPQGYKPMAGPPGSHVHFSTPDAALGWASTSLELLPLIMKVFLHKQVEVLMAALTAQEGEFQQAREDQDVAWAEKEALEWAWNTSVRVVLEQVLEVRGLQEHLMQWEVQPMEEAEEQEMVLEGGLLQAELEAARQREDWLANEATSGCARILHKCCSQFSAYH